MPIVNGGEDIAIEYLVNKDSPENLVLKLFKNDVTPDESTVIGDLTEADFTGYSSQTLTGSSWSAASSGATSYAEQSFTSSADQTAQTVYGWYLERATGGELVAADRFSSPPTIENNGDVIKVTPTLTAAGA